MRAGFRLNFYPSLARSWARVDVPRVRRRASGLAALACLSAGLVQAYGCSELVGLGSECPMLDSECAVERSSADGGMPGPRGMHPAGGPDAAPIQPLLDASDAKVAVQMPLDAGGDDTPRVADFPAVLNGGFELTLGGPGDVTTVSLPSATQVAPWYSCQAIGAGANPTTAVRAENSVTLSDSETPPGAVVMASDGSDTFISMQYLVKIVPIPLVEQLDQPLEPGRHYAFAIDVQSTNPEAELSLRVLGGTDESACLGGGEVLVESDPIVTPGWQTLCLPFTVSAEHTHMVLSLRSGALLGGALNSATARLFFDNLRPATEAVCPKL